MKRYRTRIEFRKVNASGNITDSILLAITTEFYVQPSEANKIFVTLFEVVEEYELHLLIL